MDWHNIFFHDLNLNTVFIKQNNRTFKRVDSDISFEKIDKIIKAAAK